MKTRKILLIGCFSMLLASCTTKPCKHVDSNNDHLCDLCEAPISEHVDLDANHLCDVCGSELSQHEDTNLDHLCDYCGQQLSEHSDNDINHFCDYCGTMLSEHKDLDRNHLCDYCQVTITTCSDKNLDGLCELCGAGVALPEWVHQMPVISIETENAAPIDSKEIYVSAKVSCDNCENEEYEFTDVAAGVRGRGNSTWGAPKKPYRIKFDKKRSMFGSEYKSKSWTLLANYFDYSLVRNYIFCKFASQLDDTAFAPCFEFVELFLNGQYEGVYLLSDQVQVGDGKVDISEKFPDDGNTGFLLEINERAVTIETTENVDYFYGKDGQVYEIKSPDVEDEKYLKNPGIYVDFIKSYLNSAIDKLTNKADWSEITEIINVETFADGYIVEEMAKNTDAMYLSTYLQKDKDGKLEFGPVWDFDIGAGNSNYGPGNIHDCPSTGLWANKSWFGWLLQYKEFVEIVANKLVKYQPVIKNLISELDVENENGLYAKYGDSFERNFVRWPILGQQVWQITEELLALKTNKEHINFLKNWLTARNDDMLKIYPTI